MTQPLIGHNQHDTQPSLYNITTQIIAQHANIESWLDQQWKQYPPPFYGSIDLRNSFLKIAPIDTNLFPAGFNNLHNTFMAHYAATARQAINNIHPTANTILIVPEDHTRNILYFENLVALQTILQTAGFTVRVGSLNPNHHTAQHISLPSGHTIQIESMTRNQNKIHLSDFLPDLILLNNDLSDTFPTILQDIQQIVMPHIQFGWFQRLKSSHFTFYQQVAAEFAQAFDLDTWLISPLFERSEPVNFMEKTGMDNLAKHAEQLLSQIQKKYDEYSYKQLPFLAIKSNSGTYGMAVMMIHDPETLFHLNRKQRTKMSRTKGKEQVTQVIIQEGLYSLEKFADRSVAEPVMYLMGQQVLGGFYRTHQDRNASENLNSPGMRFRPIEISPPFDLAHHQDRYHRQLYVYSVIARLAFLAAARELSAFDALSTDDPA